MQGNRLRMKNLCDIDHLSCQTMPWGAFRWESSGCYHHRCRDQGDSNWRNNAEFCSRHPRKYS